MRLAAFIGAFLAALSGTGAQTPASAAPFALPVRAKIVEASADGKGWLARGEIAVTFAQAQAQLAAKVAAAGWAHLHTVRLGRDRVLEAWSRGGQELTLMIWRVAVGRSEFSYGVSSKAGVSAEDVRKVRR